MSNELDAAMTAYACSPTAANRQAVEANKAINDALTFSHAQIVRLEAELSAARWAADQHLHTVIAQAAIIKGQAEQLAKAAASGASPCR